MKQVFLSGSGQIDVLDVPLPGRMRGAILVRNCASLISSGTEGAAVTRHVGARGLVEKALSSAGKVEQVWNLARTNGIGQTMDMVRGRLQDATPIGYSCAGVIVNVSEPDLGFQVGDRVIGMGTSFANHAEYVVLPRNLAVKAPAGVGLDVAAFGAVACIALQGIRRLDLSAGSRVGVVGLGLVGQLTVKLLSATGAQIFGIDRDPARAALAAGIPGVLTWSLDDVDSRRHVHDLTDGAGLDGVIITAGTKSSEPVNLAFDLCRTRGRVVIVGDVGLELQRAKMYRKELDVRLSCSYGPGRYDDEYEIDGRDYPLAHARWTERRNLEYFATLLSQGRIKLDDLISARFPVADASAAYALIKSGSSDTLGVLLDYGEPARVETWPARDAVVSAARAVVKDRPIRVGLIGLGGFAKAVHLPNLRKLAEQFTITTIAARSANTMAPTANRLGIGKMLTDYDALLADPEIDAVVISTRHASHAALITAAIEAGKHVFVEKPMAIRIEEALAIDGLAAARGVVVRVGFNRRFSPYLSAMREVVGSTGRRIFSVRVNIGAMGSHWSNTKAEGGRLMGEGVHFFDLCNWFIGAEPDWIFAGILGDAGDVSSTDTVATIGYPNGGLAHVTYTTLGAPGFGKEQFEAFGNGQAASCRDFNEFSSSKSPKTSLRAAKGDKGHLTELKEFAAAVQGKPFPIAGASARAGLLATALAEAARMSAVDQVIIRRDAWNP